MRYKVKVQVAGEKLHTVVLEAETARKAQTLAMFTVPFAVRGRHVSFDTTHTNDELSDFTALRTASLKALLK